MDLDASKGKKLTAEERKRRWEKGLCLYCGSDKHKIGGHPGLRPLNLKASQEEDGGIPAVVIEEPKNKDFPASEV